MESDSNESSNVDNLFDNFIEYDELGVFEVDNICDESDKENANENANPNRVRSTKHQIQKLDNYMEGKLFFF